MVFGYSLLNQKLCDSSPTKKTTKTLLSNQLLIAQISAFADPQPLDRGLTRLTRANWTKFSGMVRGSPAFLADRQLSLRSELPSPSSTGTIASTMSPQPGLQPGYDDINEVSTFQITF